MRSEKPGKVVSRVRPCNAGKGYTNAMKPGKFHPRHVQDFIIKVCKNISNQTLPKIFQSESVDPDQILQQGNDRDEKFTFKVRSKYFR